MYYVGKVDEYGKGAWIALTVLGFWLCWPLGVATLAFALFSGRMACRSRSAGRWYNAPNGNGTMAQRGWGFSGFNSRHHHGSGNAVFDEYRAETLKRLEEEQKDFVEYLERLRQAKDKQEFDQFMADRQTRPDAAT